MLFFSFSPFCSTHSEQIPVGWAETPVLERGNKRRTGLWPHVSGNLPMVVRTGPLRESGSGTAPMVGRLVRAGL